MRTLALGAIAVAALGTTACSSYSDGYGLDPRYRGYSAYDYDRPDPSYGGYFAERYYVDNPRYRERRLAANDRVYYGRDGRYYCRRGDGTTGLVIGGIAGGVLGTAISPGGSGLLGALLGGAAGAAAGEAIDRRNVTCR